MKCWQIRRQTKAPQAAGTIHSDFERGFICAEVVLASAATARLIHFIGFITQQGRNSLVETKVINK